MENNLLDAGSQSDSFSSFINRIRSTPPESSLEDTGLVSPQNGGAESLKSDEAEKDFLEPREGEDPFDSFTTKAETELSEFKRDPPGDEENTPFLSSFLIELIHSIKSSLATIFNTTLLTIDRLEDPELRKHSQNGVKEEIKKIDAVLNSFLNFININTPIIRTNTLNLILEEIIEANEKQIQEKNLKVFRKSEKDLPETFIHHEQVRFILHSVLQYAILSASPREAIGFLIKPCDFHNGSSDQKTPPLDRPGFIDVVVGFTDDNKGSKPSGGVSRVPAGQKEEPAHLILKLVEEILQKNLNFLHSII